MVNKSKKNTVDSIISIKDQEWVISDMEDKSEEILHADINK
jgi:hypothetical protein